MKLKKIASLALAGVMAVSMLTACGDTASNGGNNGGEGEGEGEGTVVSGYSSVLGEALKDVDCIKDKDYITFQDSAADETALQAAVDAIDADSLKDYAEIRDVESISGENTGKFNGITSKRVESIFVNGAKISDDDLKAGDLAMKWYAGYINNTTNGYSKFINTSAKDGALYVVNGAVTVERAVKMVAEEVKEQLVNGALPETNAKPDECKTCAGYGSYKYNYTISVSVVDKTQQSDYDQASNSAHFIAVTVSRTAKVA